MAKSWNFETTLIPKGDNMICISRSKQCNIGFVTASGKATLSFNLEKVQRSDADRVIEELKGYNNFTTNEIIGDPRDYTIICNFTDVNDNNIINALEKCFGFKLMEVMDQFEDVTMYRIG